MSDVNSRDYWDERFRTDWDKYGGGPQSRFFACVALALLPGWLKSSVRAGGANGAPMTLCDIGCAEGAGTHLLAEELGIPTTGVDFAAEGIALARERHPGVDFRVANLLAEPGGDDALDARFDIVFSSNTLEHFHAPWAAFDAMAARAERFLVLLLPWREGELQPEHFVEFTPKAIPLARDGWVLAHASAADVADWPDSRWAGDQVLFVYARPQALIDAGVSLADVRIDDPEREALQARLAARAASAQASAARAASADAAAQTALARATTAEAKAQEADARATSADAAAQDAVARATSAEAIAQAAGARATSAEARAQEAGARADNAEARASTAESATGAATTRAAAAEARAAALETKLKASEARTQELDRMHLANTQALADRDARLGALDHAHEALLARQPALERDSMDLARIRGSRTWRWTAPLRKMAHVLLGRR